MQDQYTQQVAFYIALDPGQGGRSLNSLATKIASDAIQQHGGEVLTGPCGPVGTALGAQFDVEIRADFAQDPVENANKVKWAIRHSVPSTVTWDILTPLTQYIQEVDRATSSIHST